MKNKKMIVSLLAISFVFAVGGIVVSRDALAETSYKTQEITLGTQASYPRMDGKTTQLFSYVNTPINWDVTESVEMKFTLAAGDAANPSYLADRHWAIVMNDILDAENAPNYTALSFYQGGAYYPGIQFDFKSEANWAGNFQMSVYDGTGKNNTGAYAMGWGAQFAANTENGAKESGSVSNFSTAMYYMNQIILKITCDAEYYNFSFSNAVEGVAGTYTYSLLRTRVNNGKDFTNNPYIGLYCCDYSGTLSDSIGYNVSSVVINTKKSIIPSMDSISMDFGTTKDFSANVMNGDGTSSSDIVEIASADTEIVTYDNGKITAVGVGSTTLILTSGTVTKVVPVIVNPIKNKISIPFLSKTLIKQQEIDFAANVEVVEGSTSNSTDVTYTSSNENVAKVENGKIVAISEGKAIITATSVDDATVACEISVLNETVGNCSLEYVSNYDKKTSVIKTTNGLFYMANLSMGENGDYSSGKLYIDLPMNMSKEISFDFRMICNNQWATQQVYYNFILNDLLDEASENKANIQKLDLNLTKEVGLVGFQTRLYSDAGWEAWNNFQFTQYTDLGEKKSSNPHTANFSDPKINNVVSAMRNDNTINVKINYIKDDVEYYVFTMSAYDDKGELSNNIWQLRFPVSEVNYNNGPYLGIMVNNYGATERELGFIISNFFNGYVESINIEEAKNEPYGMVIGENNLLNVNQVLKNGVSNFDNIYTWESSDTSIVDILNDKIIGKKPGNAQIRVTDKEGNIAVCDVAIDVSSFNVVGSSIVNAYFGDKGESYTISVIPDDVPILYKSSNENVVKMENGELVYLGVGSAVVTIYAGLQTFEIQVNVDVKNLTLSKSTINMDKFDTITLTVDCDGATGVVWESSDQSIVSVDDNGKISALDYGTATITVRLGSKVATCLVVVEELNNTNSSLNSNQSTTKKSGCRSIIFSDVIISTMMIGFCCIIKKNKK